MKKLTLILSIFSILLASCSMKKNADTIDLNKPWKFNPGDDLAWAAPGFDDSGWDTILPSKPWEYQGFKELDGFAWYRMRVVIPSSLKQSAYLKDSLQILLGRIDDCDQVFLNGELIGENGVSILQKTEPGMEFTKVRDKWNLDRRYVLPANDPRILWDKENVIAIRVFDQGGLGGVFAKPFEISMADLKNYIGFELKETPFKFEGDTVLTKVYSIANTYSREDLKGKFCIEVFLYSNGNSIYRNCTDLVLQKQSIRKDSIRLKIDLSKPAYIVFTFKEEKSAREISEQAEIPYILTPPVAGEPRINGASVFGVRPWSPFLFKVAATGEPPLKYSAENLPKGLKIDSLTGIITGSIGKKGEYIIKLKAENLLGNFTRDLKIIVGNKISLTPPMGWNSWNCWGLSVSDKKVRESADFMKSTGLVDHGWSYVNIDDGWEDKHDKDGKILTNWKFPNMRGLGDYLHSQGMKFGIYSSPGPRTCGGYEGSYSFEDKDAKAYEEWGIDYLKYDWCSYGNFYPRPTLDQMKHPYITMKRAIRLVNRDIHYSLCQYGMGDVWTWGAEVDGNSWRTTGDIEDTWESMSGIGFEQGKCSPYAAPGRWNDPDMLVVGQVGWGPALHATRLTPGEQYTHITLWCMLSAPLLLGCDLSQLDPFTLNLLTNDEVLAVNQDPLGKQAIPVKQTETYQVWVKDMEDGSKVAGIFNLMEESQNIVIVLKDLSLTGPSDMRDLWKQKDLGPVDVNFEIKVLPHAPVLLKFSKRAGKAN
jgi:alpha-galactosidase